MSMSYSPGRTNFGLLPEPERSTKSFIVSMVINGMILAVILVIGMTAKKVIQQHQYEQTELIVPTQPPPEKVKEPPPPKLPPPPKVETVKLDTPKIQMPKPEPKPEIKPVQLEAKVNLPVIKEAKPAIIMQPQPKAALTAAMPAQDNHVKPSTAPVHFGQTFGATPNPNATRPATIAAIGNPYGGNQGPAVAPHGIVGSTGIGNSTTRSGSNAGTVGRVASAGIPGTSGTGPVANMGKVGSAGIPAVATAEVARPVVATVAKTDLEILSKPTPVYTPEARQLRVQGDVVLRVLFRASGQVVVQGVVRGLGHGLDEEARRVAQLIRFRPATVNGQPVDSTNNITISFQLA